MNKRYLFIIVAMLIMALASCQSTSTFYQGKIVAADDIIPLPGSADNDTWETFDLTVNYSYSETGAVFDINGQVQLSEHFTMNYTHLRNLDVYLVFVDSLSKVVHTERLINNPPYNIDAPIYFSGQFDIPQRAVAFSFAYDGAARDADDERKGSWHMFWHLPRTATE